MLSRLAREQRSCGWLKDRYSSPGKGGARAWPRRGYRYTEPDDIEEDLTERFQAIVGSDVPRGDHSAICLSYDRAALAELQREEVRIGAVELECENRELDPVEQVVRPEHETFFRKSNRRLIARARPADR